jgi:hypothetical protein
VALLLLAAVKPLPALLDTVPSIPILGQLSIIHTIYPSIHLSINTIHPSIHPSIHLSIRTNSPSIYTYTYLHHPSTLSINGH